MGGWWWRAISLSPSLSLALPLSCSRCRPGKDERLACGKKGLLNICVYPLAKTNRLYLLQSNSPSTGKPRREGKLPKPRPILWQGDPLFTHADWGYPLSLSLISLRGRRTGHVINTKHRPNVDKLWAFSGRLVIVRLILFHEWDRDSLTTHLEGVCPLREWEGRGKGRRRRRRQAGKIDYLPSSCFMGVQQPIKQRLISGNILRYAFYKSLTPWHCHACWVMDKTLQGDPYIRD